MTKQEIIAKIKQTASEKYDEAYGWSVIVECFGDEEIEQEFVAEGWDLKQAMAKVRSFVEAQSDHYDEIKATAF